MHLRQVSMSKQASLLILTVIKVVMAGIGVIIASSQPRRLRKLCFSRARPTHISVSKTRKQFTRIKFKNSLPVVAYKPHSFVMVLLKENCSMGNVKVVLGSRLARKAQMTIIEVVRGERS